MGIEVEIIIKTPIFDFETVKSMTTNRRNFIKQATIGVIAGKSISQELRPLLPVNLSTKDEVAYWKLMRKQFPLTHTKAYLNNGTMGPSPYPVIDAVHKYMADADVMAHYGGWENTAKKLASFVGVDEKEIALTTNVTQGINIVCWGLQLKKGDEVIITNHEHAGNALPWLNRMRLDGIVIKVLTPAPTAAETFDRIVKLHTNKTKVIAVPHVLCTQGQILPVKQISEWGKSKGLFVFIDGAHGPGMMQLNLKEMGCDAYATCCHKWMLGPKGTGFLYVRKEIQDQLIPKHLLAGGDNGSWDLTTPNPILTGYADSAHRYYGGTLSNALYKGVDASIDFINAIGQPLIEKRIRELGSYVQEQLLALPEKVEMVTPLEPISRAGVIAFRLKKMDFQEFYKKAAAANIVVRAVPENKVNCIRVSTHIYNNTDEINQLIDLVKNI